MLPVTIVVGEADLEVESLKLTDLVCEVDEISYLGNALSMHDRGWSSLKSHNEVLPVVDELAAGLWQALYGFKSIPILRYVNCHFVQKQSL